MLLIGLTGGIASGKSTVARQLVAFGAVHVDADALAREVVEPGTRSLDHIRETFGADVIDEHGRLDRVALGAIVFSDPARLAQLNAITHPAVWALAQQQIAGAQAADPLAVVIYDVPLLVEASANRPIRFDLIVVTQASVATRLDRLVGLRGMTSEEAGRRIGAQADDTARLAIADVVIDTEGSLESTREQVDALWSRIIATGESAQ